jgi:hypothetical protein
MNKKKITNKNHNYINSNMETMPYLKIVLLEKRNGTTINIHLKFICTLGNTNSMNKNLSAKHLIGTINDNIYNESNKIIFLYSLLLWGKHLQSC